ncbi:MAG: EamA family transporter [Bacteroidota bacterium]|nr:EamA family transporter [Bacteroidota bacterium]MDP4233909.1 EamA family transporter [Bacteroidota bacterium]MDP4242841.1 EamA family transporter [Bacteroidota bacterium]MDP4288319.1 EamA family transporter [Bacteroidota bacterium]
MTNDEGQQKLARLFILLAALLWSTGGVFIKEISLDAWGISFWRSGFAAATIYSIYRIQRGKNISAERWLTPLTIMSAVCYAVLLVLFVLATKLTTSANAIFLQYTAPVYVLFIEPLVTRTARRRGDLWTVLISIAAMALFFIGRFEARSVWGNIAALASGVAFAAFAVLLKHERATQGSRWHIVILGHMMIAAAMGLMGLMGLIGPMSLTLASGDLIRLLYLGIVQIGLAYALFTFGISRVRAIDATLIAMVEPVLNPIWVYLGVGERPTNYAIVGGAIILCLSLFRTVRGATEEVESARAGE